MVEYIIYIYIMFDSKWNNLIETQKRSNPKSAVDGKFTISSKTTKF